MNETTMNQATMGQSFSSTAEVNVADQFPGMEIEFEDVATVFPVQVEERPSNASRRRTRSTRTLSTSNHSTRTSYARGSDTRTARVSHNSGGIRRLTLVPR